MQDIRHALRLFRHHPGFFTVSVLTIALAIGGCTAVFSVVNGVLLRPLEYPDPDAIVWVAEQHPGSSSGLGGLLLSNHTYYAWRSSAKTITELGAFNGRRYTFATSPQAEAERVEGTAVTASLLRVLGIAPIAGRTFTDADAVTGAPKVVILGHDLWMTRLGGDRSVLGRTVQVDGAPHEVVGIAPAGFSFPTSSVVFTPYSVSQPTPNGIMVFAALARMAPGATPEQVRAEATAAARSVTRPYAAEVVYGKGGPVEATAQRLGDRTTASVRPALIMLSVGIGLVLIIACANVTNLFLSRGASRAREMVVRAAIGAPRARLVRQLLVESLLLSAAGGLLGVLLGWGLTRAVPALAPTSFPRLTTIEMDGEVLLVAAVLTLMAGTISGLLPALRGSRSALSPAMRESDLRTATASGRARPILLAAEAALAVVLLVGSALLGRSFARLASVDTGYDASNVLSAVMVPVGNTPPKRLTQVVDDVLVRLRAMPNVEAAGAGTMAPFGGSTAISGFRLPDVKGPDGQPVQARALSYVVSAGYSEALAMRLIEGRFINESDMTSPVRAMVVNEAFVKTYFTDGRPAVGRRYTGLMASSDSDTTPYEVVGVAANILPAALTGKAEPAIFVAKNPGGTYNRAVVLVRTTGDPAALGPTLRTVAREIEPNSVAIDNIATLASRVSASVATPRFAASVLAAFATLALILAAIGLYGVLSYNVTTRRREIGVRAALGADRRRLLALVIRQGLGVTAIGLVIGLIAAAFLTRLMETLLFGIEPLDILSFATAPAVLLGVALVACAVPARRAARVEPAEALREG